MRETGADGDQEKRSGSWMFICLVSRFLEIWTFGDIWALGKCEHSVGTGEEVIFLGWQR